jgi:hypothetical protein
MLGMSSTPATLRGRPAGPETPRSMSCGQGLDHRRRRRSRGQGRPCREWAPLHSHPWDELTYVLEGELEFTVGGQTGSGGPGTLVSLPRRVPHTLRVPSGTARFLLLTVGAPSLGFLREVGEAYASGPTLERLVEIAGRHGVEPAFDLPGP